MAGVVASDPSIAGEAHLFASAASLAAALADRTLSSRELLESYLRRIERHNGALNAVVTLDAERALAAADAADRNAARGTIAGPLHGLPMTVKDCFETAGIRTTAGATELRSYVPDADAIAVSRLRAAGAIVFGKTNMPSFAGDAQSYNKLFGTTNNPWDLSRTPGGSSGGSAAATAAGLSALELGSDIGGSLRIPAHYCGVYALKPTHGIVPLVGHIPPPPGTLAESDIGVAGPVARAAEDLDLALSVIAGPHGDAATGWRLALPKPRCASLTGYRLALKLDDPYSSIDRDILAVYARIVTALREAGARIDETAEPPSLAEGHAVAQQLIQGAVARWLPDDAFAALVERAAGAEPDNDSPPVRWARNVTQRVREYQLAEERRLRLKAAWSDFFRRYDALLCPVMPNVAIPHDHNPDVDARTVTVNGETRAYGDVFAWLQSIGAMHLPAVVAPVGSTGAGLPVGIQIVTGLYEDRTAIDVARRMAGIVGGFRVPPSFA